MRNILAITSIALLALYYFGKQLSPRSYKNTGAEDSPSPALKAGFEEKNWRSKMGSSPHKTGSSHSSNHQDRYNRPQTQYQHQGKDFGNDFKGGHWKKKASRNQNS